MNSNINNCKINAFQVYWTTPMKKAEIPIFYLFTLVLSALMWKTNNGESITLYTDKNFYKLLSDKNLLSVWDKYEIITEERLTDIDIYKYWSIGKFYAYSKEKAPCICIDTDLIIWENITSKLVGKKVLVSHWESVEGNEYYFNKDDSLVSSSEFAGDEWDWDINAVNTSICYFRDQKFKDFYVDKVLSYMKKASDNLPDEKNRELLFAEQRLFSMCYKNFYNDDKLDVLFNATWRPEGGFFVDSKGSRFKWDFCNIENNDIATHVWVEKRWIATHEERRNSFCEKVLLKLKEIDDNIYSTCFSLYENETCKLNISVR